MQTKDVEVKVVPGCCWRIAHHTSDGWPADSRITASAGGADIIKLAVVGAGQV